MNRRIRLGIATGTVLLGGIACAGRAEAPKSSPFPVDVQVPIAPTPVRANGRLHLVYELHLTSFIPRDIRLRGIDVLPGDGGDTPLVSYRGAELAGLLGRPGAPADLPDKRVIGGGLRAVAFLRVSLDADRPVPGTLRHRLAFEPLDAALGAGDGTVEAAPLVVRRGEPIAIDPPLRGGGWLAGGSDRDSGHRRALLATDGKARIAQRLAIDWVRFGPDGKLFHGDAKLNANWYGYGAEILAVADGAVVAVKDGLPENVASAKERAVPMTLETVGGNHVIIDLGEGRFAYYAHMQPGSLRVKVGDRVRPGQVLGLLGNTGNSDAPHLHFHVADANSQLGAEGLPYVLKEFAVQGTVNGSEDDLIRGATWKPDPDARPDRRRLEIPLDLPVIDFP